MLRSLTVVIISLCLCLSKHVVHLKYTQFLLKIQHETSSGVPFSLIQPLWPIGTPTHPLQSDMRVHTDPVLRDAPPNKQK